MVQGHLRREPPQWTRRKLPPRDLVLLERRCVLPRRKRLGFRGLELMIGGLVLLECCRVLLRGTGFRVEGLGPMVRDLLHRNVQRFRGGLVCKAHILFNHSIVGLRVIKKKREEYLTDLTPTSSTLNHHPYTLNHQPCTLNHQLYTLHHQPCTPNHHLQPETLNRKAWRHNYSTKMCSGSEAGSYLRLTDLCITQL